MKVVCKKILIFGFLVTLISGQFIFSSRGRRKRSRQAGPRKKVARPVPLSLQINRALKVNEFGEARRLIAQFKKKDPSKSVQARAFETDLERREKEREAQISGVKSQAIGIQEQQIDSLKREVERLRGRLTDSMQEGIQLRNVIGEQGDRIRLLDGHMLAVNGENRILRHNLTDLSQRIVVELEKQEDLASLVSKLEPRLRLEMKKNEAMHDESRRRIEVFKQERDRFESDQLEIRRQLAEAHRLGQSQVEEERLKADRLRQELLKIEALVEEKSQLVVLLGKEVSEALESANRAQQDALEQQRKAMDLAGEVRTRESDIDFLKRHNAVLKKGVLDLSKVIDELNARNDVFEQAYQKLQEAYQKKDVLAAQYRELAKGFKADYIDLAEAVYQENLRKETETIMLRAQVAKKERALEQQQQTFEGLLRQALAEKADDLRRMQE